MSADAMADMYAELSNVEMAAVLDGGSTRRVARPHGCGLGTDEGWLPAWIDLDGLWIDDPTDCGYVQNVAGWEIQYPY